MQINSREAENFSKAKEVTGMDFDLDYVENKTLELVTSGCIETRQ